MKKLLFIALLFISVASFAQRTGVVDKSIHATELLETDVRTMVSNDTTVFLTDVSYHEFSTDAITWTKDTTSAEWVRFSNDAKNTWWVLPYNVFEQYWALSGDTLSPIVGVIDNVDSLYSHHVNADVYFLEGDTLSLVNIYTGGTGEGSYYLRYGGDTAYWSPLGSGFGETNLAENVGDGDGVYYNKVDSVFQFRTLKSLSSSLTIDINTPDTTIDFDLVLNSIVAGIGIAGGGNLEDGDVTVRLYFPELLEQTSLSTLEKGNDWVAIYDQSAGMHKKIHPYFFHPDVYVNKILDAENPSFLDFSEGDGIDIIGDGSGGVVVTAEPIVLRTDGTTRVTRVDTIDIVAGDNITVDYSDNGVITIASTGGSGSLPICDEGQFLAYIGGQWSCVDICDYVCTDTIISIINDYNDTANVVYPDGNVLVNFTRTDCEDSIQIVPTNFVSSTLNLTGIIVSTAPTIGEIHCGDSTIVDGDTLFVTLGSFAEDVYYVANSGVGSAYTDNLSFESLYSSNSVSTGMFTFSVSISACVEESVCFGYLYNGYTVSDTRELTSSAEWSVPTTTQYNDLVTYLGGYLVAGGKLKTTGTIYWNSPNTSATNEYGFNGIGGGYRSGTDGTYSSFLNSGRFRSTSGDRPLDLAYSSAQGFVNNLTDGTESGFSIRLVSDATGIPDGTTTTYTGNDGKTYNAVVINELYWTTENLEETQYRNGDEIPIVQNNATWAALTYGAACVYDNDANNACKTPLLETATTFDISNRGDCGSLLTPIGFATSSNEVTYSVDGTKAFFVGSQTSVDSVYEVSMSVAWDVTTMTYVDAIYIGDREAFPTGIDFKPDGTTMFITGFGADAIHEYSLSTPWDITTASFVQSKSISAISSTNRFCEFANNGTVVYLGTEGSGNSNVYKCDLSTAWDISTLTYSGVTFNYNAGDSRVWGFDISEDGLNVLVSGVGEDNIAQFFLSTPFDISTSTLYSFFTYGSAAYGVEWKPDGTKFFGYTGTISGEVNCFTVQ